MGKEGVGSYTEKDFHNILTLSRSVRARQAYEDIHLLSPAKDTFMVRRGEAESVIASPQMVQVWRGVEIGARNELMASGHIGDVQAIYEDVAPTPKGDVDNG